MKKIAIVLAGCGVKDGSEIHESVLTLLAVIKNGAEALFYAPNIPQKTVTNHLTGKTMDESRNVLVESARIARGEIKDIKELNISSADAVIFPGGFGSALNLSDFAIKGADCTVLPEVERVLKEFHAAKKPIGVICIAPNFAAKVLGGHHVKLTIGNDKGTADALQKLGAVHENQPVEGICVDESNKVVSTPAYMLAENIADAEKGISKLVSKVVNWA